MRSIRATGPNASINPWEAKSGPPWTSNTSTDSTTRPSPCRTVSRTDGLQIFVRLTTIELTPERPRYDAEGLDWDYGDGLLDEYIVATTIVPSVGSRLCDPSRRMTPISTLIEKTVKAPEPDQSGKPRRGPPQPPRSCTIIRNSPMHLSSPEPEACSTAGRTKSVTS